jgi:hypothetical protein
VTETSAPVSKEETMYIQEVIRTFLYYAPCVDSTMLTALGLLATQQANPTTNTMKQIKQFLDYAATHLDAIVTYHASDMVLARHSNASYLSKSNARSRAGRHFFYQVTQKSHLITAPSSQPRKSSKQLCRQRQKPKSERYSSIVMKQSLLNIH